MKNGFHAIDSDLHVIEMGEVYEKYSRRQVPRQDAALPGLEPDEFPALGRAGPDHPTVGASAGGRRPATEP